MFSTRKGNLFGLFFVIHFVLGSYLVSFLISNVAFLNNTIYKIGLSQLILVFLPILYYFIIVRTPVKTTLRFYKTRPINLLLAVLLAISSLPLVMLINVVSQFFVSQGVGDMLETIGSENFFASLLVIAVFPGLFEEMIARGIILSHYRHKKVLTASIMSGFFFGMMHLNINQFLYAFFLGFMFSIVVHLTGSIFTSMFMHFIINGINLSMAYIATSSTFQSLSGVENSQAVMNSMDQSEVLMQALPAVLFLVVLATPFLFLLLYTIASVNNKVEMLKHNSPSMDFFNERESVTDPILQANALTADDEKKQRTITIP